VIFRNQNQPILVDFAGQQTELVGFIMVEPRQSPRSYTLEITNFDGSDGAVVWKMRV
jgi:hypothetical protein